MQLRFVEQHPTARAAFAAIEQPRELCPCSDDARAWVWLAAAVCEGPPPDDFCDDCAAAARTLS
jgi:hypothetical protein